MDTPAHPPQQVPMFGTSDLNLDVHRIRNRLVNGILNVAAVLGLPAVVAGTAQLLDHDRYAVISGYMLVYAVIAMVALAKKRISYRNRARMVIAALFLLSAGLLVNFGVDGMGIVDLLALCAVTTVLLGMRAGIWMLVVSMVFLGVAGSCFLTGQLSFTVPAGVGNTAVTTWLTTSGNFLLLAAMLVAATGLVQDNLQKSLALLQHRTKAIQSSNQALMEEMTQRQAAERSKSTLEAQLFQAQKMEALGLLAGGVAHDFNNVLTVIRGNTEVLIRELPKPTPEELHITLEALDQAVGVSRQLLAFSRQQTSKPQDVQLNDRLTHMRKMIERLVGERVRVKLVLHPEARTVRIDPVQLDQVIINLAANARDAMPQGGELTISTHNVPPDGAQQVELTVTDTGIGMEQATMQRIFEPFFTTKPIGKGTGLGLSTVYGIVNQHGGSITVESKPNQGTTFRVVLPVAGTAMQEPSTDGIKVCPSGRERLLVVDDDRLVVRLVARVLGDLGYGVTAMENPVQALEFLAQHQDTPVDLLITDVMMPNLSGPDLYEQAKASQPGLQVLFMSGHPSDALVQQGLLPPQLLSKPFTIDSLARAVRDVLDGRADISDELTINPAP